MNIGDGRLDGPTSPFGDRYTIVRELGEKNGQTYLVKDGDRYEESCVVKSLLAPIQDAALLEEAKSIFEQEAEVLYRLDHRQIPQFRQLLEAPALSGAGGQLFLVQDYIQGPSYQSLLQDRKQVGGRFHEVEINQLLYQLLPVFSYIHAQGLIHRDVCPENIILRQTDGLPVLVEFGSVKALAASVRSRLGIEGVSEIGSAGYVPPEQVGNDYADETSDLYGLAATLLVLATGETPKTLRNSEAGTWQGYENLSPKLSRVLRRMLSPRPEERYPTAEAVLRALQAETLEESDAATSAGAGAFNTTPEDTMYSGAVPVGLAGGVGAAAGAIAAGMTEVTGYDTEGFSPEYDTDGYVESGVEGPIIEDAAIDTTAEPILPMNPMAAVTPSTSSAANAAETYEPEMEPGERMTAEAGDRQALLGLLALLGITSLLLLFALPRFSWFPFGGGSQQAGTTDSSARNQVRALADGEYSPEETVRKREIDLRRGELGLSEETFAGIVNQLFYQEYPALLTSGPNGGQQALTAAAADEPLRIRWDHTALELLDKLEQNFSAQSLSGVGTYGETARARWRSQIEPTGIANRAQTDLTDAKFFSLFPSQSGRDFLSTPIGQLYYAIADDRARAIASGSITENIRYDQGTFNQDVRAQLDPGEGRIYTLALSNGQLLRLNLSAPSESTLLSLYPPNSTDDNPAVFADSEQTTWSGALSETGLYSVVVINRASEPIDYTLATSVDNVTSTPAPTDSSEDSEDASDTPAADGEETEVNLDEPPIAPPRESPGEAPEAEDSEDGAEANSES